MRRLFPAEPVLPSPELLHPALQSALNSLDVQLETELTRYRRQRVGIKRGRTKQRVQTTAAPSENRSHQSSDRIAAGAIGGRTQPLPHLTMPGETTASRSRAAQDFERDPWQPEGQPVTAAPVAIAAHNSFMTTQTKGINATPAALDRSVTPEANVDPEIDNYFASSEELLRSLAEEEAELRREQEPGLLESLLTPLGIGSLLLLLLSSITVGYLILNPASFGVLDDFFRHHSASTQPTDSTQTADATQTSGMTAAAPTSGSSTSPDLSAEEFKDLNLDTLSTLPKTDAALPATAPTTADPVPSPAEADGISGIAEQRSPRASTEAPPRASESSAATPAPTVAVRATTPQHSAQPSNSSRAMPTTTSASRRTDRTARDSAQTTPRSRDSNSTAHSASPVHPARSAAPAAAPPASRPVSRVAMRSLPPQAAASGRYYYVIADYSGDRSLEQARQAVGDAYVRNFPTGARVQLGAFSDEARARELAQQLAQQGVSAQIYSP